MCALYGCICLEVASAVSVIDSYSPLSLLIILFVCQYISCLVWHVTIINIPETLVYVIGQPGHHLCIHECVSSTAAAAG